MGTTAARQVTQIVNHVAKVLAIELICAVEAADFLGAEKLSPATHVLYEQVRSIVPRVIEDRSLGGEIERVASVLLEGDWLQEVEQVTGALY